MAEVTDPRRDPFPPNVMHRIGTPVRYNISNLQVSRERPWGNILVPVAQQQTGPVKP